MKINYLDYIKLQFFFNSLKSIFITKKSAQSLFDNKVDKETGKGLSENNYTTSEKEKITKLNFSKLISSCEISGYTLTFKDIDDNIIHLIFLSQHFLLLMGNYLFLTK